MLFAIVSAPTLDMENAFAVADQPPITKLLAVLNPMLMANAATRWNDIAATVVFDPLTEKDPVSFAPLMSVLALLTPVIRPVIVPPVRAKLPDAVPVNAAVIVPALKLPEPSRATMAPAVLAFVAFDVTVNVALPAWLAVNVCEPDRPVPDTFIVSVPLLTLDAVVAVDALPFKAAVIVPALKLPEASRATSVETVLADVAFVAIVTALEPL